MAKNIQLNPQQETEKVRNDAEPETENKPVEKSEDELFQEEVTAGYEDYKKEIANLSLDELKEEEKKWLDGWDKIQKEIYPKKYELPEKSGKLTRSKALDKIVYFLNKIPANYSSNAGQNQVRWLYNTIKFWKGNPESVEHKVYEAMIKLIGERIHYTGFQELESILELEEYLEPVTKMYKEDIKQMYKVSVMHSAVMDAMKLATPVETDADNAPQPRGTMEVVTPQEN